TLQTLILGQNAAADAVKIVVAMLLHLQ
ncbi:hypothetical protein A2U01_0040943, partial [Trifolium medium]|nr:hypothetical protein [Trifolium medium]